KRGGLGDDLAQRVHQVAGQVRAGGVPAPGVQGDGDRIGGGGEGAHAGADFADVELRLAVHRVYLRPGQQRPVFDDVDRATGVYLFRGLEHQAHVVGQAAVGGEFGQCEAGAEDDGGVNIVPAGVGEPVGGGELHARGFRHGQRVEV